METTLPQILLVPTDMSPRSLPAAAYAAELARRLAGTVVLLHVVSPKQAEEGLADGRYVDQQLEDVRARLRWWFSTFVPASADRDVRVTTLARVGYPEQEIPAVAQAIRAAMIVMATHGRTGLPRAVLGSVAEAALRQAPCPVLTLPLAAIPNRDAAGGVGSEPRPMVTGAGVRSER